MVGTYTLLETARAYFNTLSPSQQDSLRFLAVLTDEVYGSLRPEYLFTEETAYDPRARPIPRARLLASISRWPGSILMAYQQSSRIARTIKGPTNFQKNWSP